MIVDNMEKEKQKHMGRELSCIRRIACGVMLCLLVTACEGQGMSESGEMTERREIAEEKGAAQTRDSSAAETYDDAIAASYEYSGQPYEEVHGNVPFFEEDEYSTTSFEHYAPLDDLGRCGAAYANVGRDLMPTEERGAIGAVKPTAWHLVKYNGLVDGNYLYNRCHLIAYMLSGENANEQNLITGTRYMNVEGMLPFETRVADYVRKTGHHVLYRVTPVFAGDYLLADGVLMEAYSVEDFGEGVRFCVFVFNVQPGIEIDYATGESWLSGESMDSLHTETEDIPQENLHTQRYVLNTNTKKFHLPTCASVYGMKENHKKEAVGNRAELMDEGYAPCQRCNP